MVFVIASEAKQSIVPQRDGLLGRFAPRNDDAELEKGSRQ
jgi:hypothetical protein